MPAAQGKLLLTIREAANQLGIGRSHFYELVRRGEIMSVRLGRCRRVPAAALERFVQERIEVENES